MCDVCKSRTLLVLDDDELQLNFLELLLHARQFVPHCFTTPSQAVQFAASSGRQVTLLIDVHMPDHDPAEFCARMREACRGIHMVGMSASLPSQSLLALFDRFLLKPISAKELDAALCACLAGSQAHTLDSAIFDCFAQHMSPQALDSLYAAYFADAGSRFTAMQAALENGNTDYFRGTAHALKGSSGMLGLPSITATMAELEGLSAADHRAHAGTLLKRAQQQVEQARLGLASRLQAPCPPAFPPLSAVTSSAIYPERKTP